MIIFQFKSPGLLGRAKEGIGFFVEGSEIATKFRPNSPPGPILARTLEEMLSGKFKGKQIPEEDISKSVKNLIAGYLSGRESIGKRSIDGRVSARESALLEVNRALSEASENLKAKAQLGMERAQEQIGRLETKLAAVGETVRNRMAISPDAVRDYEKILKDQNLPKLIREGHFEDQYRQMGLDLSDSATLKSFKAKHGGFPTEQGRLDAIKRLERLAEKRGFKSYDAMFKALGEETAKEAERLRGAISGLRSVVDDCSKIVSAMAKAPEAFTPELVGKLRNIPGKVVARLVEEFRMEGHGAVGIAAKLTAAIAAGIVLGLTILKIDELTDPEKKGVKGEILFKPRRVKDF